MNQAYYLGEEVEIIADLGDWCYTRWANGKEYWQWRAQVTQFPFGKKQK